MSQRPCCRIAAVAAALTLGAALAAAQSPGEASKTAADLPLETRGGALLVKTRVNGSEPLTFKLDTGFGVTTIHPELVAPLRLSRAGRLTIVGIAGEEEAATYEGAVFDLGGMSYSPRRVASLPSDTRRRAESRAGILGAGFFRRFVVEIDPVEKRLRLCEPKPFAYAGKGEVIPIEFKLDTPIIEALVCPPGKPPIRARFEIDTGCDGCVCLGSEFVETNRLLENSGGSRGGVRSGVGGATRIQRGELAQLQLGALTIERPSASLFLQGSPSGRGQAGHIGWGALRRFRIVFDYSRRQMILEPPQ